MLPHRSSPRRWEPLAQPRADSSLAQERTTLTWRCIRLRRLQKEPPLSSGVEYFNVFNRTPFGLPNGVCNTVNLTETVDPTQTCAYSMGVVNSTVSGENNRIGQLGAKFTF